MLQIKNVTLSFSGITALNNLSIEIPSTGITGIIGPNGAGKSTLFNVITGLYKATKGEIYFNENQPDHAQLQFEGCTRSIPQTVTAHRINKLTTESITALGVSRTFQTIRLLSHLNVIENLCVACAEEKKSAFFSTLLNLKSSRIKDMEIENRAYELLDLFSLKPFAKRKNPTSLPYGDQRKLEMARALMRQPKMLLLDEPAAGMNATEKQELLNIIKKISEKGVKVVVIEHDMKFIMELCDLIFAIGQGALIAQGTPQEIQQHPEVIERYLGTNL